MTYSRRAVLAVFFVFFLLLSSVGFANPCSIILRPDNSVLHTISKFETTAPLKDIVSKVHEWILPKAGDNSKTSKAFSNQNLLAGGKWDFSNGTRIESKSFALDNKNHWAMAVDHPQLGTDARRWRIDIGVSETPTGSHKLHFTVHQYATSSAELLLPNAGVLARPKILRELMGLAKTQSGGDFPVTNKPLEINAGEWQLFEYVLFKEDRDIPVILLTKEFATDTFPISPELVAEMFAGSALVIAANNKYFKDEALARNMPKHLLSWNGIIRVYGMGTRESLIANNFGGHSKDYFFDIKRESKEALLDKIHYAVSAAISKYGDGKSSVNSLAELLALEREHVLQQTIGMLEQARAEIESNTKVQTAVNADELTTTNEKLETSLSLIKAELAKIKLELEESKQEKSLYEEEYNASVKMIAELEQANADLQNSIATAFANQPSAPTSDRNTPVERINPSSSKTAAASVADFYALFAELPKTPAEALDRIESIYQDRIVVTAKAKRAAKNTKFKDVHKTWKALMAISNVLYDMYFGPNPFRGDFETEFKTRTGIDLAIKEGSATMQVPSMVKEREDEYLGEKILALAHLKIGTFPAPLRIHYYADPKTKKIVISHVGDHLTNPATRTL